MNVFVLCTGRTASTAITAACKHITNFTSAHESRVGMLSAEKLKYPDNHIEIDNRLIWFSHQLQHKYGDSAKYVHLKRDRTKVATSYAERWNLTESIVKAYGHGILMKPNITKAQRLSVCLDYVDHVESSIELFLQGKPASLVIHTENLKDDFKDFWQYVGAEGDINQALAEFDIAHNVNKTSFINRIKNTLAR